MKEMTSHERFTRMFEHREADRIPIIDDPWDATIERWQREGMPQDVSFVDYFGLDHTAMIHVDNSPRYPRRTLEETDSYKTIISEWGVTQKTWKHAASTPQFLDFTIVDRDSWEKAKALMTPTPDRIPWDWLRQNYPIWKKEGYWLRAALWFGFDVTHSWIIGTERMLYSLSDDPEWCSDMFSHLLDVNLALLDMVWEAGYKFDSVFWWDDMGYKHHSFFSLRMYREVLKPFHQRAIDWAHAKGIKAHLHSCGDINQFVPELVSMGLDALNPLEVKAGMDPAHLKQTVGKDLVLHGGINAVLWDQRDAIEAEMRKVIPVVKESGGYIFSSDHSVPSSVSLENFQAIVNLAKELGAYQ
ncbi:MAG: uroporphyrinogen decarboxylase family protein [Caldilineaceae bacterium]